MPRCTEEGTTEATEAHREMERRAVSFGRNPISFWCKVLADESASVEQRREASRECSLTLIQSSR
jgi:hypothetical protein